jgi:hypothetical protein
MSNVSQRARLEKLERAPPAAEKQPRRATPLVPIDVPDRPQRVRVQDDHQDEHGAEKPDEGGADHGDRVSKHWTPWSRPRCPFGGRWPEVRGYG